DHREPANDAHQAPQDAGEPSGAWDTSHLVQRNGLEPKILCSATADTPPSPVSLKLSSPLLPGKQC
ncbi:MAG: hypothetical protein KDA51_02395, partial [Planctomycetales bacterium]|nr:hypothetical protein [Planctomycetales bacterium]